MEGVRSYNHMLIRAVGRSENPGVPVSFGGHNLPPIVEIGLTDLPKSVGGMAHKGLKLPKRFTNLPLRSMSSILN